MLDMKVSVLEEEESEEDEIRKMMCVPHLNGEGVYEEFFRELICITQSRESS